jgi:PAS domain-containing protein
MVGSKVNCCEQGDAREPKNLRQFERLVEGLDEMVAVVDRNQRFVSTNRAYLEVFGGEQWLDS